MINYLFRTEQFKNSKVRSLSDALTFVSSLRSVPVEVRKLIKNAMEKPDRVLFRLEKITPVKLTKSMARSLYKDVDKNMFDGTIELYNNKYADAYKNKSDKEVYRKLAQINYDMLKEYVKKLGLKFNQSYI
jgi:Asp-tRNA(Asn)/Glu-tRNA(Gln) amidotransferase A subunit family amidase